MDSEPRLLRFGEAAFLLGCSPSTVRKMAKAGDLRTVQLIQDQRIPISEIDALIERKLAEGDAVEQSHAPERLSA